MVIEAIGGVSDDPLCSTQTAISMLTTTTPIRMYVACCSFFAKPALISLRVSEKFRRWEVRRVREVVSIPVLYGMSLACDICYSTSVLTNGTMNMMMRTQ